jgi:alkylated DNA repair dioxygenase AlkB
VLCVRIAAVIPLQLTIMQRRLQPAAAATVRHRINSAAAATSSASTQIDTAVQSRKREREVEEGESSSSSAPGDSNKKHKLAALFTTGTAAAAAPSPSLAGNSAFHNSPWWLYFPHAVPTASSCARFYSTLRRMVDPTPGTLFIFGRKCVEHRLTKAFARQRGSMQYSGTQKHVDGEWPEIIEELHEVAVQHMSTWMASKRSAQLVQTSAAAAVASEPNAASNDATASDKPYYWDTVLINYYRDGCDSIDWHSDKDAYEYPIASFSFGAERPFLLRPHTSAAAAAIVAAASPSSPPSPPIVPCSEVLSSGSLLIMQPGMQQRYQHAVPTRKNIEGGRVNVTFRMHHRGGAQEPVNAKV